jgi:hypothetical protein
VRAIEQGRDTPHHVKFVKQSGRENPQLRTNIHEFLGIRKGEFIANGGHDRFFTRVEICVAM